MGYKNDDTFFLLGYICHHNRFIPSDDQWNKIVHSPSNFKRSWVESEVAFFFSRKFTVAFLYFLALVGCSKPTWLIFYPAWQSLTLTQPKKPIILICETHNFGFYPWSGSLFMTWSIIPDFAFFTHFLSYFDLILG